MKVIANQPYYFPMLHWWERALRGKLVLLDDVLRSPTNPSNRTLWFDGTTERIVTLPIPQSCRMSKIDEIPLADRGWFASHRAKFTSYYRKQPYFAEALKVFDAFGARSEGFNMMVDVIEFSIDTVREYLELPLEVYYSRRMPLQGTKRSGRMVLACQQLGGDVLVLGGGSNNYLEEDAEAFKGSGVTVEIQNWTCPVENRSVLDALARLGRDRVLELLGCSK